MNVVSEPIGLEIVAFNNGSYTGAILFTGFMYVGAAGALWMVRAWKIGEEEGRDKEVEGEGGSAVGKSSFGRRMVMWRKV